MGPMRFTPRANHHQFEGKAAIGRVLMGVAGVSTWLASPISASWNRLGGWLRAVDGLRRAA